MRIDRKRLSELRKVIARNDPMELNPEETLDLINCLAADHDTMAEALSDIRRHTDPNSEEENYRADDSEGCLDAVFAIAKRTLDVLGLTVQATGEESP